MTTASKTERAWRFLVAQMGARRHYSIPRAFERSGILEMFYTDLCSARGWPALLRMLPRKLLPASLHPLADRFPEGVPKRKIRHWPSMGVRYALLNRNADSLEDTYHNYLWAGTTFCEWVKRQGFGNANAVYAFSWGALELLAEAKARGLRTVLDQFITPELLMNTLFTDEHSRWPDWEDRPEQNPLSAALHERNLQEWKNADTILCCSDFVRDGVIECGGPPQRTFTMPSGFDPEWTAEPRKPHDGPMRVLFVGQVGLRKGAPYILEAARRMKGRAVFRMVGALPANEAVARSLKEHVEAVGKVPRSQVRNHYQWADVFLLPSLCEGSPAAGYEALAAALPMICTPNTGSVVREGVDGYIVPIRDADAIVGRLERLAADPGLRAEMSRNALERSREYTIAKSIDRLIDAINHDASKTAHAPQPAA